ncbi:MAG: autotransporter-associated beta strand repeat-containing protein [Bacteroidota bacterium]
MLRFIIRYALLFTTVLCAKFSFSQVDIFWRDNASSGNWIVSPGECDEIGTAPSQWWYPTFSPNNARNSPFCFGEYYLVFDNNHIPATSNNDFSSDNIYGIRFDGGATTSRTISGQPLRLQAVSGNNPKIENQSSSEHTIDQNIEIFNTVEFNPVNGSLILNGNIITNNNFIDIFGDNGHTLTINGAIDGTNGIGIQQNSTVVLNGSNSYTGGTFINNGKVIVNSNNGLGAISGSTTVTAGATLEFDGADALSEPLLLNGTGDSNQGALRKVSSGTDDVDGSIQLQSDSRIVIDQGNFNYIGAMDLGGNTVYIGGDGNFNFESSSSLNNATKTTADGAILKDGSGTLEFRPTTSMTGNLQFLNGEVRQFTGDYANSGLLVLSNVTYRSNIATNRDVAKPTQVTGNITLGFGTGANSEIDFQTSVEFVGGNRTLTMTNENFISGLVTGDSFTKAGTGTLTLSGSQASSLSGTCIADEGVLILDKDAGVLATGALNINSNGTVRTDADNQWGNSSPPFVQIFGGTLDLNNTNQRLALAGDASASITLGSGTISIEGTGTDTFAGVISGSGGVTKEGTGTEILSGSNTYTGSTTITEGVLELGASEVLPDGSQIVLNGGTLRTTGTLTETAGTLELSANSTLDLAGSSEDLTFSNSSAIPWDVSSTLTVTGWTGSAGASGTGSQIFVSGAGDLTEDQLLRFQFSGFDFGAEILPSGEIVPAVQVVNRFDNFNRGQSDIVGSPSGGNPGTWIEMEDPPTECSIGNLVQINSDGQLQLARTPSGSCIASNSLKTAAFDITGEYSTTFRDAGDVLVWYFNMRHVDGATSAFNRSGFILGCTESDFTSSTAKGYAVMMGDNSPGTDEFTLIHFSSGIPLSSTFSANEIIAIANSGIQDHYSIRVSFDPCSDTWSMTVRNDGSAAFMDPASITTVGSTAVDVTNVNDALPYIGVYRRHNSSSNRITRFDNIYIPSSTAAVTTYAWNGSVDTDYQNPSNWTPTRSCTKGSDQLTFNLTSNTEVTNVQSETITNFSVSGAFSLTLRDAAGDAASSTLMVTDGNMNIDAASTLIVDVASSNNSNDGIGINLSGGSTATVDGTIIFRNSNSGTAGRPHRFIADGANEITVNGALRVEDLSGNLFDGGEENSVVFNSGSAYESLDGGNPFGLTAPASRVVFQPGSTFRLLDDQGGLSINGRTYANFEYNTGTTETLTLSSLNAWTVDSLIIISGGLEIQPSGNSYDINIGGNFRLDTGTSFGFSPNGVVRLNFNGANGQQIYGDGALSLSENVIVSINNTSSSETVELEKNLSVLNDFELLDGELQGNGATLTMSGEDHTLLVNSDLAGEVIGANDEINLVVAANTILDGNSSFICEFLNVTVQSGNDLTLRRGIEVIRGSFEIESTARLVIESGGFIENANTDFERPNYQNGAFLVYNSGDNPYGRGLEWSTNSAEGYPFNVSITGNTNLSPGFNSNTGTPLDMEGNLFIESGSGLFMDFGGVNMTVPLTIGGNLQLEGGLSGSSVGGNINIGGNWTQTGGFFPNNNSVTFNGSSTQTLSSPADLEFFSLAIDNANGLSLSNDIEIINNFTFTDGIVSGSVGTERVVFLDNSTVTGGSNTSHIDAWIEKQGDDDFTFPTGAFFTDPDGILSQNYYQPIRIEGLDAASTFEARYFAEQHPNAGQYFDGQSNTAGDNQEISNCDYWTLSRISGTESARVVITYGNTPCNQVLPGGNVFLQLAKWDGFSWEYPLLVGSDPNTLGEVSTIGEVASFSDFTLASNRPDFNVLPITLLSFRAEVIEGTVRTAWVTASEQDNDFFTVERAVDGINWEAVGEVEGAGDSNVELLYSLVDERPYSGVSYYRLRQNDFNGTSSVSDPVVVEIRQGSSFSIESVYRGTDGLSIKYKSKSPFVTFAIYDVLGKRITEETLENNGNGFITLYPNLPKGSYIVRLSHGSEIASEKFIW